MDIKTIKRCVRSGLTAFLVLAGGILFYFALFHMETLQRALGKLVHILLPLLYGAGMAYLLCPAASFFEKLLGGVFEKVWGDGGRKREKILRTVSIFLTVALLLAGIYLLLALLLPELVESLTGIIDDFPFYVENVQSWLLGLLEDHPNLERSVSDFFERYAGNVENWLREEMAPQLNEILKGFSAGLMGLLSFVKNLVLGLIISVYILCGRERLAGNARKALYALLPVDTAARVIRNVQYIDQTFGGYLSGMILDSLNIGILCYIGMLLMKIPFAVLVSAVVAVTNVIPFFGPYLGGVPSTLLILMADPPKALYFVIFIFLLQQLDGNLIAPKILGGATGLSSFMVVTSIILAGGLFGVPGMLVGVPVIAVLSTIVRNRMEARLEARGLPTDQEFYMGIDHLDPRSREAVWEKEEKIRPGSVFECQKKGEAGRENGRK